MSIEGWAVVATFTFPTESAIAKGKLEAEGIECKVEDELTVQAHNFYSNAIGGVKLLVQLKDVTQARSILVSGGFVKNEIQSTPRYVRNFEALSSRILWVKKYGLAQRFLILSLILLFAMVVPLVVYFTPSDEEVLIGEQWCVDALEYQEKVYKPHTIGLVMSGFYNCDERLYFRDRGEVNFPGFNTRGIGASWVFEDGELLVYAADTLNNVFEGYFEVEINGVYMTMTSENTRITCSKATTIW
ncbi:MAG: hypothetical protein N4A46_06895 [Schleiferiaceae bacterium]|jgi:hypothetical protein|nr:hypothetical protein [Schleiferiaceae bacterium]